MQYSSISAGWKSHFEGVPAITIDTDDGEDEGSGSDLDLYVLRASSSTELIPADSLYPISSTADILMTSSSDAVLPQKFRHTPYDEDELSAAASASCMISSGERHNATIVKKKWIDIQVNLF